MQTVLVVDDDPSVRELITVILEVEGYQVVATDSAEDALDIAHRRHVDVVTIDLSMPGMTGVELAHRLHDDPETADVRQMIISGQAEPTADLPVDAVLAKPFDFTAFVDALQRHVDPTDPELRLLDQILASRRVTPVFQPICDLETGEVVAVEGLTRGPEGPLHSAYDLFRAAHRAGRLHELDAICRLAVIETARAAAPLTPPLVTVNVEPGTVHLPMCRELREQLARPLPFRVVVEFTERALTRQAPALLRHAEEIRARGDVVALDDVGAHPGSVAMMPLTQPEIVKLDLRLLADELTEADAAAAGAAVAYAERTGAVVVAEGIETPRQRAAALALGATWGQGRLFGMPAPMQALAGRPIRRDLPTLPRREQVGADLAATPYGIARAAGVPARRGDRGLMLELSRRIEQQAVRLGAVGAMFVCLQDADRLRGRTARTYAEIAHRAGVLGVLGRGVHAEPVPRAYGVDLPADDPVSGEWAVCVVGPHDAALLAGRPAADGSWAYVLTHDPAVAHRVARLLTCRLTPRP